MRQREGGAPVCFDALRKSPCAATGLSFIPLLLASLPPFHTSLCPLADNTNDKIGLKGKHAASKGRRGSCDHRHEGSSGVISLASVVESDSVLIIVKAGSHLHPMPQ